MLHTVCVSAYAKINIGLKVLPKRPDGYHGIESIFQTIPVYDLIEIRHSDRGSGLKIECMGMSLPEYNTFTAAYAGFCRLAGVYPDLYVRVRKNIPAGAGLGGGSSDAACFLRALDKMCGTGLSSHQMELIASEVGSDVFFFLSCGADGSGCAVVTGRGEKVRNIRLRHDIFFAAVFPGVHISTREAYSLVDEYGIGGNESVFPALDELEEMYKKPVREWAFANSFELALVRRYPIIGDALDDLRNAGADYVQMSGSGSAVFGVFESSAAAENASGMLADKWKLHLCGSDYAIL